MLLLWLWAIGVASVFGFVVARAIPSHGELINNVRLGFALAAVAAVMGLLIGSALK